MDKLLSRALRAKAAATRKLDAQRAARRKDTLSLTRKEHVAYQNLITKDRKESRMEEKTHRLLGPLTSPRLAVGKEEMATLGAFEQLRVIPPAVPYENRIKFWNIREGDRVVILKGPDRHKIGTVKSTDKGSNTLIVEKMNMVPMKVPEAFLKLDANQAPVITREQPLHYNDVRLVHPLHDPVTGEHRDTVIANIAMSPVFNDRILGTRTWTRYVAGTKTAIPWPPEPEKQEKFDQLPDTKIMDVEIRTFMPTLLQPPLPVEVVDELRGKYSKFRTRHEPGFMAKIEALAAKEKARKEKKIRTPIQEANRKAREERKKKGPPVLSDEMAEKIGQLMAQKRPELLEGLQAQAQAQAQA